MSHFQYSATDANGKMVRGSLEAQDNHQLAFQLQQSGLFLVSWESLQDVPPATPAETPPPPVPTQPEPSIKRPDDASIWQDFNELSRKQRLLLAAILACGIGIGCWLTYQQRHPAIEPEWDTQMLKEKMVLLRRDMKRSEVDHLFGTRDIQQSSPQRIRYFVPPDWIVEVPFDQQEGSGSPDNRIKLSELKISRRSTASN